MKNKGRTVMVHSGPWSRLVLRSFALVFLPCALSHPNLHVKGAQVKDSELPTYSRTPAYQNISRCQDCNRRGCRISLWERQKKTRSEFLLAWTMDYEWTIDSVARLRLASWTLGINLFLLFSTFHWRTEQNILRIRLDSAREKLSHI